MEAEPVSLLAVEPDLAADLDDAAAAEAGRLQLVAVTLPAGDFDLNAIAGWPETRPPVVGLRVLRGGLAMTADVIDRRCSRLLVKGDVLLVGADEVDSVPATWTFTALRDTTVVVLDARLLTACRRWPDLLVRVLASGAGQVRLGFLQQAYSQLPRVETRILALLWSVADRIGRTRPQGVELKLAITHETLGHMVGARRPTVSLALTALENAGLIQRDGSTWFLDRRSLAKFTPPEVGAGTLHGLVES